jgi:hypothetical protein
VLPTTLSMGKLRGADKRVYVVINGARCIKIVGVGVLQESFTSSSFLRLDTLKTAVSPTLLY